nr:MAG: RNA-dependent RNA polymerase [Riboviria sp.]
MKFYRRLQRAGAKEHPLAHFHTVVGHIERVLGKGSIDPSLYGDSDDYAEKYLAYNLRRKIATPYNEEDQSQRRKAETLKGFLLRESVNRKINSTETFGYDPATGDYSSDLLGYQVLYRAKEIIRSIVKDRPNLDAIVKQSRFGNGASATLRRTEAQAPKKFEYGLSTTSGLLPMAKRLVESSPAWSDLQCPKDVLYIDSAGNHCLPPRHLKRFAGAVMDFVRKTFEIDRVILKEPELNGFFQKGIGSELRKLLRLFVDVVPDGIDLNTSGDLNSELAQAGSADGHIATVDGERASDSLTLALFEFLFPEEWNQLFLMARSPYVRLPNGKWHRLQMMSGMGNGFTFEAESIIFYAIGLAASEWSKLPFAHLYVSIHGDDLTVPSDVYDIVVQAYTAAGVVVNETKSFSQGPFRESCGGHWFNGHSVKPFYVKFSNGLTRGDWFWLANSLLLWLQDRTPSYLDSSKGKDLFQICQYLRWYSSNGVTAFWRTAYDRSRRSGLFCTPPVARGKCWRSRNVVDVPKEDRFTDAQAYVSWLCNPVLAPTVMDLLTHTSDSSDPYSFSTTVYERERTVQVYTWPFFCNDLWTPSLWASLDLHKLDD